MDQSVAHQFQSALSHLLAREGRGAQSRLAGQQNIDRGYVNAIVKGRKPGSDEVKAKMASHFNMTYEDMLALGRSILGQSKAWTSEENPGKKTDPSQANFIELSDIDVPDPASLRKHRSSQSGLSKKIMKVVEILESDTSYRDMLLELIDVFHELVNAKSDRLILRNQMEEMESRITSLERRLAVEVDRS